MGQFLLVLVVAIVAAAIVFGVVTLIGDGSAGMAPAEPDGRAVPLPGARPLAEKDVAGVRFDTTVRGYRMEQVDQALRRAAYDIGYKDELITVLTAEVEALRDGRQSDADGPVDADGEPAEEALIELAAQDAFLAPAVFPEPERLPAPPAFAVPGDEPPAGELADDTLGAADESDTDTAETAAEPAEEQTGAAPATPRNGRAKRASADRTR
jgi:DivIVA domain-containing protein